MTGMKRILFSLLSIVWGVTTMLASIPVPINQGESLVAGFFANFGDGLDAWTTSGEARGLEIDPPRLMGQVFSLGGGRCGRNRFKL